MSEAICLTEDSGMGFWINLNHRLPINQPTTRSVICPHCEHPLKLGIWEGVNVTQKPELKARVLSRALFKFFCNHCARSLQIGHSFLYLDARPKLMIWLPCVEAQKPPLEEGVGIMQLMSKAGYSFRQVKSQNELIEKIRIFDDGQDDRAVEALKLSFLAEREASPTETLFYGGMLSKHGDRKMVRFVIAKADRNIAHEVSFDDLLRETSVLWQKPTPQRKKAGWLAVDRNYAAASLLNVLNRHSL